MLTQLKACTYAATVVAAGAAWLSGVLSPVYLAWILIGLPVSWFWETQPLQQKFRHVWTVLAVLAMIYSFAGMIVTGDPIVVGIEFLLFLLVLKHFQRTRIRDYRQIFLLIVLVFVGSSVINTQISYGVLFFLFVILATWGLVLLFVISEQQLIGSRKRILERKFYTGSAILSVGIFAAASILFFSIPRVGLGYFVDQKRRGVNMVGFSNSVRLGGHGTLKKDQRVVMRVQFDDPKRQSRQARQLHWRGSALDFYANGQWRKSTRAPGTWGQIIRKRRTTVIQLPTAPYHQKKSNWLKQQIYLEPIGYDVLFAAATPTRFEVASKRTRKMRPLDRNGSVTVAHGDGLRYTAYSDTRPIPPHVLRNAKPLPQNRFGPYLQLPDDITQETRTLALRLTEGKKTQYDKVIAVESWLKENFAYTLQLAESDGKEPVHFFLFERKKGHCEYFASAMAVLLRAAGIPTRNTIGFLGGEWNEYENYLAIRAGDAHSWVEVYFEGVGWVTFDPTPAGSADILGPGKGDFRSRMRRYMDSLKFKWMQWVIEYDLSKQLRFFKGFKDLLSNGQKKFKDGLGTIDWKRLGLFTGGGALVAGFVLALWLRRRNHQESPTTSELSKLLRLLEKQGHQFPVAMTPKEIARELEKRHVPSSQLFKQFVRAHYRSRYGLQRQSAQSTALQLSQQIQQQWKQRQ